MAEQVSRYATAGRNSNTSMYTTPATSNSTADSQSSSQQQSTSESSSFSGIVNEEALSSLMDYLKKALGGGTEEYKKQIALRQSEFADLHKTAAGYSKDAAFQDAAMLMQQQLQKSMEANMPAILKSITGAGTSASSMQGLLSQKLATDSAQAAGALGAEQAKAYGNISANLASVLEKLSAIDTTNETNFLKALDLLKISKAESSSQSTGSSQSTSTQRSNSVGANNNGQTATNSNFGSGSTSDSPFSWFGGADAEPMDFSSMDSDNYYSWE